MDTKETIDTDNAVSRGVTTQVTYLLNPRRQMHYWTPSSTMDTSIDCVTRHHYIRRPLRQSYRMFMDEHRLWRHSTSAWLKDSYDRCVKMLTHAQLVDLKLYQSSSYKLIVHQYLLGNQRQRFHAFDDLWTGVAPVGLPLLPDTVLFEGRTDYQPEPVGSVIKRFRPTSTSWTLGVAVSFADEDGKTPVVFVHRCPDATILGINMQILSDYWPECEILLQPRIQLRIDRIIERVSFTDRQKTRSQLQTRVKKGDDWDGPVVFDEVTVVFTTATKMP